ncbi:hypothetical protein [Terrilactibacillus laevilacticus]|uniref:Phage protein n=1 Tax=Terrilactibacillus laevilacticus TaxID=1380157 RepID=A0ABW5PTY8_9BACI|nr:hypothetical protein [Terrilactibacillus laevilacticus]
MTFDEFEKMDVIKRVLMVNDMLGKEKTDALKNVAAKLQLNYSSFTKEMRNGGFNYNQAKRQYEKVISIEEYQKVRSGLGTEDKNEVLFYLAEHFEELKRLLSDSDNMLVLDKQVYDPNSKLAVKSIKVNNDIYEQFINLCEAQFPHLKLKDLVTQALLDFTRNYSMKN